MSKTLVIAEKPSVAADIARGLPTALTLACADPAQGAALQRILSTPVLRLYTAEDVAGAELGGALKNVIAIAAGICLVPEDRRLQGLVLPASINANG